MTCVITMCQLPQVGQRYQLTLPDGEVEVEVQFVDCDPDNEDILLVLRRTGQTGTTPMPLSEFLQREPERLIRC
jgi:hypothetical protein